MNILTVNLVLSTLVFWIAARLYLLPRLSRLEPRAVVVPILLLHSLRHLGLMFLAPGAVYPGIPRQFAVPAAFGDLVAAVLALIAIPAVVNRSPLARPLVGLLNIAGTLDLIAAITLSTVTVSRCWKALRGSRGDSGTASQSSRLYWSVHLGS